MLHFLIEPVASNLASLALRNDGCEIGRPSIVIRFSLVS